MKRELRWVLYVCLLVLLPRAFAESCPGNNKDTVQISGQVIVFYGLSQAQFSSLSQDDQEAYTELLTDFYEYAGRLTPFLDKHGIKHILTGSRFIEVKADKKVYCYDKTKLKEELGIILVNGEKSPKLIEGAFTDLDMMPILVDYYSLK